MSSIKVEVQLSLEELLKAVEQLSIPELEQFVSSAIALQAKRRAINLPQPEAELLLKINQGIPADTQKYYNELIAKREAETLTPNEHKELLQLTEQIEQLQSKRIEYLADLARIRKVSLTELRENLGIKTPVYV
jgi:hypothetical protein